MLCSKSAWVEGRRQVGPVQVAWRIWDRCRSLTPGSWPRAWNLWSHPSRAIGSRVISRAGRPACRWPAASCRIRRAAGQRPGQFGGGEFLPVPWTGQGGLLSGAGAAADQFGDGGVLEAGCGGFGPVQGADDAGELVVGAAGEPVIGPGGVLGEAVQGGAAGGGVEGMTGGERAGRAR